ncbi:MAG: 50S ribosome-binding GTPase, partial [Rickettsiales bacterium]|nr:50S ribosome-binding GTPase [Rickettsiales bacterium]
MKNLENNLNKNSDAIYALSSGIGKAGVAVFRISGDQDIILDVVCKMTKLNIDVVLSQPRYAFFSEIFHSKNQEKIDDAIIIYFPAPHSFTGECVLEIQSHGGFAVVQSVLDSLSLIPNLKIAERGEFTKRAFFNGKMDLLQVEGLADLIDANTDVARRIAMSQMSGKFSSVMADVREKLILALSLATAQIDFLYDEANTGGEKKSSDAIQNQMVSFVNEVLKILEKTLSNHSGEIIRSGILVAIIGAPNVGKSSLFNAIIGREKSIISEIPGTTRDVVDAVVDIGGIAVELADTAGLRDTIDKIESEGIARAIKRAENSDIKILV